MYLSGFYVANGGQKPHLLDRCARRLHSDGYKTHEHDRKGLRPRNVKDSVIRELQAAIRYPDRCDQPVHAMPDFKIRCRIAKRDCQDMVAEIDGGWAERIYLILAAKNDVPFLA